MDHTVRINNMDYLTHNVIRLRLEKPKGFEFTAGQAVEMTVDPSLFNGQRSPFTMTNLNHEKELEFVIKIYPQNNGMTLALSKKRAGDTVVITDAWDSFINKGPGVFIAGGTGITPFIALLRQLDREGRKGSTLFFSNNTRRDIFLRDELTRLLGNQYRNVLTREPKGAADGGVIDIDFLKANVKNFRQPFYVCGPPGFVDLMQEQLASLGVSEELVDISL